MNPYLYVVLLVARMHHAVVYEIPTAAAPENAIAKSKKFRVSDGLEILSVCWSFKRQEELLTSYDLNFLSPNLLPISKKLQEQV